MKVVVYENLIDVEDLNHHSDGFIELVQAQSWEVALMTAPKDKVL